MCARAMITSIRLCTPRLFGHEIIYPHITTHILIPRYSTCNAHVSQIFLRQEEEDEERHPNGFGFWLIVQ